MPHPTLTPEYLTQLLANGYTDEVRAFTRRLQGKADFNGVAALAEPRRFHIDNVGSSYLLLPGLVGAVVCHGSY